MLAAGFLRWRCHGKWLMLFSLKFQRNNQQHALAADPADGKTGEKGRIFHRAVKIKQPHARRSLCLHARPGFSRRTFGGMPASLPPGSALMGPMEPPRRWTASRCVPAFRDSARRGGRGTPQGRLGRLEASAAVSVSGGPPCFFPILRASSRKCACGGCPRRAR